MKNLNAFDIMNRIMRRENFLIAFVNREVLNLRVPLHYMIPFWKTKNGILTESLMWNLKYIINFMFDADFKVKEEIIRSPYKLRRAFIWLGVLNMVASPFIFFFVLVYTFFKYSIVSS
jgi:autophagy-related protein 9